MFDTLLIANRGEIACRVIRTARKLGIRTVAVFSDADADAQHVRLADEAHRIGGPRPQDSYLRGDAIIEVAKKTGAQAIHPGYGFLSENADFADAVQAAGIAFIGPSGASMRKMGSKAGAKDLMAAAGVPVVPGYTGEDQSPQTLQREADRIGILVFVLLPNGPRNAPWLTPDEQEFIVQRVHAEEADKAELGQRHSFTDAFKDGRVWALAVVYFCGVVCFYAVNFWMPTIIQELGVDKKDFLKVGLLSMIPWGCAAIAMVYWGSHSDRTGERRWHAAAGLLVAICGLIMLALVGHAAVASIIALTLVTVGLLCWVATFWSLPTAFLSGTAAAAGIAWINSVGNLGGHFGPDLIGRIRAATGGASEAAFWALAAVALLGVAIILLLPKTQRTPGVVTQAPH